MPDIIDRIKFRLIKWLASGNTIILNAEILPDRRIRPMNLGPVFISSLRVEHDADYALLIGGASSKTAALHLWPTMRQGLTVSDSYFIFRKS